MTIDIAISTYRPEGIERLAGMDLPRMEGVRYVVSWQSHGDAPVPSSLSERSDVEIHRFDVSGQSHNRNNALAHCRGDIVIISDDDVVFLPEGIRRLREAYEENPEMDVATFRSVHDSGVVYPREMTRLKVPLPKGYYVACIEISLRREACGDLLFNPELGLNSPRMHGGEDEVFVLTAIKRGLDCRFVPVTVCEHRHASTGLRRMSAETLRAKGCVVGLYYPSSALLRLPVHAMRLSRAGHAPFFKALRHMLEGLAGVASFRRRTRRYL